MKDETQRTMLLPDEGIGGCPKCGRWDESLSVGPEDWFICRRHRTKFLWGGNINVSWGEPEEERKRNAAMLDSFEGVTPAYPAVPPTVAVALEQVLVAVNTNGTSGKGTVVTIAGPELTEAVSRVRDWLKATRAQWIQYVYPERLEIQPAEEGNQP